jgi:polyhydroxyalkanoate synthase
MTIGAQAPTGPGLLKGKELATTFSFLRPTTWSGTTSSATT